MVGNVAFRSATFGGFNREDVMSYIEKSVQENKEALEHAYAETAAVQEKADELARLNEELKKQLENQQFSVKTQLLTLQDEIQEIISERDNLKDKVDQMEVMDQKMEEMENRFQALHNMNEQQREELARCKEEAEEKDKKIQELLDTVEKMREDSDSYRVMCGNIGQIEMDVRYRIAVMEKEAQSKYDEKLAEAQASCDKMLADAQASYDKMLADADSNAEVIRQKASDQLGYVQNNVSNAATGVNDAIAKALSEVERVQSLLQNLSGCMDEHVSAVNQLAMPQDEETGNE